MRIVDDLDLTSYNSYRIRSICKKAYFPENENDILSFFKENEDFILLGSGHNIILSKVYYEKPILFFNGNFDTINSCSDILEVEAGAMMWDVAQVALELGLSGLEVFYDIPSSLGGAIVMNAGASGEEIKDVLLKVRYLDLVDLEIKEVGRDDLSFEYRNSFFQRNTNKVVLKAWLQLKQEDPSIIKNKMEMIKSQRWKKQPKDLPNAGSVFKRPPGYYVGALIEELKMKGFNIGGAKISEKHGGFIVNCNNATGNDILSIIEEVQKRVFDLCEIVLEVEQRVI